MQARYICLNGKFLLSTENTLLHNNRAFCYGDAVFETIHCLGTEPQFFERHWTRLLHGMKLLKMEAGSDFIQETIRYSVEKLLNKNRIFKGARIRFMIFRDHGGLYTPEKNSVSWLMESSVLEHERYELNTKGMVVGIYDGVYKPANKLSNLKTTNALIYILAGLYCKENDLDECFVLNQYSRIAECISSNVFLVVEDEIVTPALSEGCIAGVMRQIVIDTASSKDYKLSERAISGKDLIKAEEIFITNAIQGIRWVGAYKDRRYFNFIARRLISSLNEMAFST
ncbi:Aminodeoxychorismate lyase [subsurface metagenome]